MTETQRGRGHGRVLATRAVRAEGGRGPARTGQGGRVPGGAAAVRAPPPPCLASLKDSGSHLGITQVSVT